MSTVEHIFTTSIYHSMEENIELEHKLMEEITETLKTTKTDHKSNMGGYQKELKKYKQAFSDMIKRHGDQYLNMLEVKNYEINVLNAWFNINPKYSYNISHLHPGAHFSGVYYLRAPKDSGMLRFWRDNDFVHMVFGTQKLPWVAPFRTHFPIEPKKYFLTIFPANLQHEVFQNNSDENRVSISFNLELVKKGEPPQE